MRLREAVLLSWAMDGDGDSEDNGVAGATASGIEDEDVGVEDDDDESDCAAAAAAVMERVSGLRRAMVSEDATCFAGLACLNRDNCSRNARALSAMMLGTSSSGLGVASDSSCSCRTSTSSRFSSDCRISEAAMTNVRSGFERSLDTQERCCMVLCN